MSNTCDYPKLYSYLKDNLNKYQNTLHRPEDLTKDSDYEGNILHTVFYREYKRSTWYFQYPELVPCTYLGDNGDGYPLYCYRVKTNSHILYNSDLCQKLPSIECQQGFRAKWTPNIGSNIFFSGELTFNDTHIHGFDYTYNDIHNQFMLSDKEKNINNINIGNIPTYKEFSDKIPQYDTSIKLPWFYQESTKSFPLYYCSILDKIEHKISLRRNINDVLIVIDDDGNKVSADATSLLRIDGMDNINENLTLPTPQMWATYIYLSDIECEANKNMCEKMGHLHEVKNVFHFNDIIRLESENPIQLGNSINIKIQASEYPVTNISWVAQNQKALSEKYYSNYSTNSEDASVGWSPIFNTTLSYGKSLVFKEMPSYRTQRIYPSYQCASIPNENGYNNWCVGVSALGELHIPGIIIKDGYIQVKLLDTNPNLKFKIEEKSQDLFRVIVYLTISKRLIFENFQTDEKMRNTSNVSIGTQIIIEGSE